jgi:hypothetical protein
MATIQGVRSLSIFHYRMPVIAGRDARRPKRWLPIFFFDVGRRGATLDDYICGNLAINLFDKRRRFAPDPAWETDDEVTLGKVAEHQHTIPFPRP